MSRGTVRQQLPLHGVTIGGPLDRNGLRPARYKSTNDDSVIMASEKLAFCR